MGNSSRRQQPQWPPMVRSARQQLQRQRRRQRPRNSNSSSSKKTYSSASPAWRPLPYSRTSGRSWRISEDRWFTFRYLHVHFPFISLTLPPFLFVPARFVVVWERERERVRELRVLFIVATVVSRHCKGLPVPAFVLQSVHHAAAPLYTHLALVCLFEFFQNCLCPKSINPWNRWDQRWSNRTRKVSRRDLREK